MRLADIRFSPTAAVAAIGLLTAAMAVPARLAAQTPGTATLTVNVVGARNATGKITVDLYREAKGFPDTPANAFKHQLADIDAKTLTGQWVWNDLEPGAYAIAVLHDENGDGKMEKNFLGMPKEGHGASNNPMVKRPPTFEEARISVNAGPQTLEIKLFY
jgi:uncharacterized protein (DUF2141 family)